MTTQQPYYVTTPIFYPNDNLHIGHCYTTVLTDVIARYKKMQGFDVRFLTGTDEHGQKIEKAAASKGQAPKAYVDGIVENFKQLWTLLGIENDVFWRTTDPRHTQIVQKIFKDLYDKGEIYKGTYDGLYCTPCENFWTERQAVEGLCPDCKRPVQTVQEEAYFFKLSKYTDKILQLYKDQPDFLQPLSRQTDMIKNFLEPGLEDLCVSRTSFKWGVPVAFDPDHVVYVWVDALSNYITYLGFGSDNTTDYDRYWQGDNLHVIGKDIVRFHAIYWPAILMALGEPLPKRIFAHGWLLVGGEKMSKSRGNVIDPIFLIDRYGKDAVRYFLMREVGFEADSSFSSEGLIDRINFDLANDLGNLLSRSVAMVDKYFGGTLPAEQAGTAFDKTIKDLATETLATYTTKMNANQFSDALASVWTLISRTNKYIDETTPWILAKDEHNTPTLAGVMYVLIESLRIATVMLTPIMPDKAAEIFAQLGITDDALKTFDSIQTFGALPTTLSVQKGEVVFPRIDKEKELTALEAMFPAAPSAETPATETKPTPKAPEPTEAEPKAEIVYDDFAKIELKIGTVLECEPVKKSERLLKSQIKIGDEVRQIVSGIAEHFDPASMVGKQVVVVTNLKPVKLRGEISQGMILAASNDTGELDIVTITKQMNGANVS